MSLLFMVVALTVTTFLFSASGLKSNDPHPFLILNSHVAGLASKARGACLLFWPKFPGLVNIYLF